MHRFQGRCVSLDRSIQAMYAKAMADSRSNAAERTRSVKSGSGLRRVGRRGPKILDIDEATAGRPDDRCNAARRVGGDGIATTYTGFDVQRKRGRIRSAAAGNDCASRHDREDECSAVHELVVGVPTTKTRALSARSCWLRCVHATRCTVAPNWCRRRPTPLPSDPERAGLRRFLAHSVSYEQTFLLRLKVVGRLQGAREAPFAGSRGRTPCC